MSDVKQAHMNLDFTPAVKTIGLNELSRPSLSYWADAWRRLKKNKRALISLFGVVSLLSFALLGPYIWTIDHSLQDLQRISQGPSFGGTATVIEQTGQWELPVDSAFPAEPEEAPDELAAPVQLEVVGVPTTHSVRLKWTPVPGAAGYVIYRNEIMPDDSETLGVPLGEHEAGNIIGFEDRLQLETKDYYYSVVATDGNDESESYVTERVTVQQAVLLSSAQELDPQVKVGDTVTLKSHPLGTDYLGRDMLARLIEGARVSLFIGIVAPLLYVLFGTFYGGMSGYLGGTIDSWMMRISDFVVALPFLLFMIIFKIAFGIGPGESGIFPMLIALIVLAWPSTSRLVRGQVLQLREEGFVQASRLLGGSAFYLIVRHMIPNTMGVILVTLTFAIPTAIFTEAFLSFIGMGVAPPTPSWGSMCNEGIKTMLTHPHEIVFPAILISLTVLAFNLLGDGLRDALDAKMRSRE